MLLNAPVLQTMQDNPTYDDVICIEDSNIRNYDTHDPTGVFYKHFYLFHTLY